MAPAVLILYASRYGQTQKIASRIADVVEQEGGTVKIFDTATAPPEIDFTAFDLVILGGGIAWGKHPRSLRRFIAQNRAALSRARTILVSVSGAAEFEGEGRAMAESYVRKLYRKTAWTAGSFVLFGGGVAFTKYGFFNRRIMARMQRKNGRPADYNCDYDYTDWDAVDRFARDIAHGAAAATGAA